MGRLERIGGWTLVGAAAGILLGMSHHPTRLAGSGLGQVIHGLMILFVALTGFGYACFVVVRGVTRPLVLAGAIAFALALGGDIAAAMINGFAVTALDHPSAEALSFAWALNQAFAKLGAVATGAAILLWSADLLTKGPSPARWAGGAGVPVALLSAGPVLVGLLPMNVAGALAVYGVQAAWGAGLGLLMLARQAGRPEPDLPRTA